MVCYCLDLRGDGKVNKFLGNKLVSILTGFTQLIIWVSGLINLIIQPGYVKEVVQKMDTASYTIAILMTLMIVIFSCLLLYGLFKNIPRYVQTYLIFNIVITVLFIISFITQLIARPKETGFSGFMSLILMILLNVLFYFIIRNYYLYNNKQSNSNQGHV